MEKYRKNMLWAAAGLVMAVLMGLSSCTKDDMREVESSLSKTEFIPSPTPTPEPTPDPIEWKIEKDSVNHGNSYEFDIRGTEVYSGLSQHLSGKISVHHEKDKYFTEDIYRDLSVSYANSHRTFGAAQVSGKKYLRGASFQCEDGQIIYVDVEINNDSLFKASVEDVTLSRIDNLEAATRAQYVSDTLNTGDTPVVMIRVNLDGSKYEYTQPLNDEFIRYLLSEDDIEDSKITSKREMIDATSEKVTVVKTVTMKSGEVHETTSTYVLPISVETITFNPRNTMSFDWRWIESDGLSAGNEEFLKEDGFWTINIRKDTYNNVVGWNDEFITPTYYVSHCSAIYNDGNDKVEFGMLEPQVEEVSTVVNLLSSDREGYEMAKVVNTIKVNYEGMAQLASEDCILYKEVEVEPEPAPVPDPVIDGYWDEVTLIDVITDNFRRVSIDWIITTDGVVTDRVNYTKEFPRTLVCQSDWSVEADDFNQNTTGLKAVLSKSTPSSDGAWSWDAEAYTIAENATGTGWTKSNSWASTEANGISVTRDGKTYHFADKSVSVNSNATVDGNGNYTSKLAYTFGDNVKSSDAPGKINQKVAPEPDPFFPKNWGKILGANQTIAPTANHDGYVYTLVFRFENGTLGVIMNGGESQINWDNFSHFTTDTDQSINGMSYLKGQDSWMFVSADDYADALTYVQTNGQMVDNIAYPKAKSLGWDEGHLVNNHASVFTSRYSMSIVDNVITISDTYTGVNYGSFDSAK